MSKKGHVPVRTCIGCRRKRKKEEMIRFIQSPEGAMFIDEKKNLNGRGFYLCRDLMCLKMAKKKKRWLGSLGSMDHGFPSMHKAASVDESFAIEEGGV